LKFLREGFRLGEGDSPLGVLTPLWSEKTGIFPYSVDSPLKKRARKNKRGAKRGWRASEVILTTALTTS